MKKLLDTPAPDQVPLIPDGTRLARLSVALFWHKTALVRLGAAFALTVILVVAGLTQAALEVKVRAIGPLKPAGLKFMPVTPIPDHAPMEKFGSCSTKRLKGAALAQRLILPKAGVCAILTVICVEAGLAQGSVGLNTNGITPLKPVGLNIVPVTPIPDQTPDPYAGSWSVVRLMAFAEAQRLAVPKIGVPLGLTVIMVCAFKAQGSVGSKVSVNVPDKPMGLNKLPLTPGPLQLPNG